MVKREKWLTLGGRNMAGDCHFFLTSPGMFRTFLKEKYLRFFIPGDSSLNVILFP